MKICRIVPAYSPYSFGGADIFAEALSRMIASRGNSTVIISINPNNNDTVEIEGNSKIYRFHPANISTMHQIGKKSLFQQAVWTLLDLYSYYSYRKIREILRSEKPDVVHMHTPIDTTLAAFVAIKSLKLPLVFTLHDYLLLCRRVVLLHGSGKICTSKDMNFLCKFYRNFTRFITDHRVDVVTGASQFILDMHRKNGFFKGTKCVVVPHGVELNTDAASSEKNKKINEGLINILYLGGLTKHKGVHILIKAFMQVRRKNLRLNIVGSGVYEPALRSMAKDDQRVVFHGKVLNKETQKFYRNSDVLVVPSIWDEVFGRVILEAFSYSTPVICSNIGGMPELVKDKYNGFLFHPGDSEKLKEILSGIAENPTKLNELSKNAYSHTGKYDISYSVDRMIEVYEEAMKINSNR